MFVLWGAIGTFVAWFAAGGKNEIWQAYETFGLGNSTIPKDSQTEGIGRVLSLGIATTLAIVLGGFGVGVVLEHINRGGSTASLWTIAIVFWAVGVFLCLTQWNGRRAHTTGLTHRCVAFIDRLVGSSGSGDK